MAGERPTELVYRGPGQPVLLRRSAAVRVIGGPDAGASRSLAAERVRVGTAADNDLVLSDKRVSRRHLEFQVHDEGYLVLDLGSTNGTFFRGSRIREVLVGPGAELRLGATVLRLERGEEATEEISGQQSFGGLVGTSAPMQKVYGMLAAVAPTDTTVLIEGETGTGKELVAEAIHRHSPRRDHSFLVFDCGAIPAPLIESELFGHERGAFTGADAERAGVFERACGGTVFLDELGELPLSLQTRLLRVLDRRTIKRVGGNLQRRVDVRLVAATNRDLEAEVKAGRFRSDLFYRLAVVRIVLPPLRQRREDVPLLARHFLLRAGCPDPDSILTPELLEVLASRRWRGNVRELHNLIERSMVFADGEPPSFLYAGERNTAEIASAPPAEEEDGRAHWLARALPSRLLDRPYKELKEEIVLELEQLYMSRLVARHGVNISRIARDAGVDRHLVRKLLRKHGLTES